MTIGGLNPPAGAGVPDRGLIRSQNHDAVPATTPSPHKPVPQGTTFSGRALRRSGQRFGLAAVTFLTSGLSPSRSKQRPRRHDAIEPLVQVHRGHHPKADFDLLQQAYAVAELSHRGQMRKSGEAYITHPIAVATLLADLGADTTTLVAALLHDTVEDTDLTLAEVREHFGDDVAYLVDGVTKLEKVDLGERAEAETIRKIIVATGRDVRVTVIKLADRLHNMRTIRHKRRPSQIRTAEVTRDVFIPLAERLGLHVVKTELEDIVFATLEPEEHAQTARTVTERAGVRDAALADFTADVNGALKAAGITADVSTRTRHHVSANRVLHRRGADAVGPFDLARVMVVVDEDTDCYGALGVLHTHWSPMPGGFKDFIATPKFNLYQSLHTELSLPGGEVAEVLIRTRRMHRLAECGVVAHTAEKSQTGGEEESVSQLGWLRRLIAWQGGTPDSDEFWSSLTADLSIDRELMVFAPGVGALTLPAGSTCVDAAYAIDEQTGHRCIGAQLNGRLVALSSVLADGETVSIITAKPGPGAEVQGPSREWLSFVRSPLAKLAIDKWFLEHPADADAPTEPTVAPPPSGPQAPRPRQVKIPVDVPGHPGATVRLARCCTPVPPDALAALPIRGGTVAVHRADCANVDQMRAAGRDLIAAAWPERDTEEAGAGYRVTVQLEALDRPRLLADVTAAIDGVGADINSASINAPREMRVRQTYTITLADLANLPQLLRALRRVQGVYDVYRART